MYLTEHCLGSLILLIQTTVIVSLSSSIQRIEMELKLPVTNIVKVSVHKETKEVTIFQVTGIYLSPTLLINRYHFLRVKI